MDQGIFLTIIESVLRIILGLRFLSSGISNIRRWPHATHTAKLVFPQGAYFFGFVATALMVLGGSGLALGFQTHIAALMLIVFLLPTFKLHL
ncbi:MAG: DoxX family membrane protein, partial [Candidatus Binatia bacterium]